MRGERRKNKQRVVVVVKGREKDEKTECGVGWLWSHGGDSG